MAAPLLPARTVSAHRQERLLRQHGEIGEYVELVEVENRKLTDDVDASNELLGELQLKYENLLDEHEALQGDLADLQQRLDRARTALRELGFNGVDAPARANHSSEAVDLAREYLADHLVIHPDACVDLDLLDGAREARAWGQTTWEAFRALHAYGAALAAPNRYSGDFWTWCEQSGDPRVWRATTKKPAMTESDTVRSNARLRAQRMLPVDRGVAPSGETEMLAHIKIAEGGGNLAPRVYFHVEEAAARVHVGYVGRTRTCATSTAERPAEPPRPATTSVQPRPERPAGAARRQRRNSCSAALAVRSIAAA